MKEGLTHRALNETRKLLIPGSRYAKECAGDLDIRERLADHQRVEHAYRTAYKRGCISKGTGMRHRITIEDIPRE